ncbi:peptide chain release factor 2 [Patescibacteria group bacterium]|nr:peptide chain release factor 2 [Patescibacteria group bacterium]MBU1673372.1 peptide chain release factor 2 [Patescibacteria group bacterium]MBU1963408.1 peptide chain release factor 2 [Patescibacteria group bacterium]
MKELINELQELLQKTQRTWAFLDLDESKTRLKVLEAGMNEPNFWQNRDKAKKVSQEFDDLREELKTWEEIQSEIQDNIDLAEMAEKEGKQDEVEKEISSSYQDLKKKFDDLEFYILLHDKYDKENALVAFHAGTGGTEAMDWAEMLLRMILRYCEQKGWQARIIEIQPGSEAGIKRAVVEVIGRYAFGFLKSESGVHRLVRISPFDAEKMRHTSFALIEVLPDIGEAEEVEINPEDLKIDVFKSSGHGGQSVNTTDSAVRITHLPTGLVVSCQNERSQHQNKATAMKILKNKLFQIERAEKEEEKRKIRGEYSSAEWGNQIRSYVLQPYKMVKDHRTKYEEQDPIKVLDGGLEGFVEAYLRHKE